LNHLFAATNRIGDKSGSDDANNKSIDFIEIANNPRSIPRLAFAVHSWTP